MFASTRVKRNSMVTSGDFYGQGYVSIAKGVNMSIVLEVWV